MKTFAIFFAAILLFTACNVGTTDTAAQAANIDTLTTAYPWALLPFNKADSSNPVMQPGTNVFYCPITQKEIGWEAKNVFNPAIVVRNDTVFMLYRAQDSVGKPAGTSRIGFAWSVDGIHFNRMAAPVLYPDNDAFKQYEWQGGCEDPRIVEDSAGLYYLTYTAYDGNIARLMIATSKDLLQWRKYGPVFGSDSTYKNIWSKSGAIVSTYTNGKIVATKINGQYWMYWGDKYIWAATSSDLIHWHPVTTNPTENAGYDSIYAAANISRLKIAVPTRKTFFDADLVESGPPAMLTDNGIVLLYNSRNIKSIGDTTLPEGTYAASQVLFDKQNPLSIISRMNTYFIKPQQPYELTGEVNNVCFIEGLAQFKNKWFLYYGTADSRIAVAIKNTP